MFARSCKRGIGVSQVLYPPLSVVVRRHGSRRAGQVAAQVVRSVLLDAAPPIPCISYAINLIGVQIDGTVAGRRTV